jgi:hypothetical protein
MNPTLFEFNFDMIKVIFIITALIQLAKRYQLVNQYSNCYPLASCIIGIAGAWWYGIADPLFSGVLMGTVASGMYKVIKESIVKQLETQNARGQE